MTTRRDFLSRFRNIAADTTESELVDKTARALAAPTSKRAIVGLAGVAVASLVRPEESVAKKQREKKHKRARKGKGLTAQTGDTCPHIGEDCEPGSNPRGNCCEGHGNICGGKSGERRHCCRENNSQLGCAVDWDCCEGNCVDGVCKGSTPPPPPPDTCGYGGIDATCSEGNDCESNTCNNGKCVKGGKYGRCHHDGACLDGRVCLVSAESINQYGKDCHGADWGRCENRQETCLDMNCKCGCADGKCQLCNCPPGKKFKKGRCVTGRHCDCPGQKTGWCISLICPKAGVCQYYRNQKNPGEDGFRCESSPKKNKRKKGKFPFAATAISGAIAGAIALRNRFRGGSNEAYIALDEIDASRADDDVS